MTRSLWQTAIGVALVVTLNTWFSSPLDAKRVVAGQGQQQSCASGYVFNGSACVDPAACPSGYIGVSGSCQDLNECAIDNGSCGLNAQGGQLNCVNTVGTRACLESDQEDWCSESHGFGNCQPTETCTPRASLDGLDPETGEPAVTCSQCPAGLISDGNHGCVSITECATNSGGCFQGPAGSSQCIELPVGNTCSVCPAGTDGNGFSCTDVNECATDNGNCSTLVSCTNGIAPAARTCGDCPSGYVGDGLSCTDINECTIANGSCHTSTTCTNNPGPSPTCGACPFGTTGDGVSGCVNIDECATNNGGCSSVARCIDYTPTLEHFQRYACADCAAGYTGDGYRCDDVNECATNNGGCGTGSTCTNSPGTFQCQSPSDKLTPSVFCVMPDASNPSKFTALFAYQSSLGDGSPSFYPYDSVNNWLGIDGADQGPSSGPPSYFSFGYHVNTFAVPFMSSQTVTWTLVDPSSGAIHTATPDASTPLCVPPPVNGQTGATGNTGANGPNGPAGAMGPAGQTGSTGATGSTGSAGSIGSTGSAGSTGPIGPHGPFGAQGAIGAAGASGAAGSPGVPGVTGPTGARGTTGAQGAAGANGATGANGLPGVIGPTGPQGAAGPSGAGVQGAPGTLGATGAVGPPGLPGAGGASLSFVMLTVDDDGPLTMPTGNASAMYLARMEQAGNRRDANRLELTLPPVSSALNRFITVRRVDTRGVVIVKTAGEQLEGAAEIREPRNSNSNAVRLENRYDYITFFTDGTKWFVFAQGK